MNKQDKKEFSILFSLVLILTSMTSHGFCIFNQNTVWEARATAIAGNKGGGCFVLGASGTDYSQQDNPQYVIGGITTAGSGNVFLSTMAAADWVGNCFYINGGQNVIADGRGQITAVTPGVDFTAVSTGNALMSLATGVVVDAQINIGGAISFNTSNANLRSGDDKIFEAMVASNTMWVKNSGTILISDPVSLQGINCSASTPCYVTGYNNTRGDDPSPFGVSTTAPSINVGANGLGLSAGPINLSNLFIYGTASNIFSPGGYTYNRNLKIWNLSNTANRAAYAPATHASLRNSELVSVYGFGMNYQSITGADVNNIYVHDTPYGGWTLGSGHNTIKNSLFANCAQLALHTNTNAGITTSLTVYGVTIDGFNNVQRSTAIWLNASTASLTLDNSIIANCYGGIVVQGGFSSKAHTPNANNVYWNLVSTVAGGFNLDLKYSTFGVNPQFEDNTELYGSTAATASGVLMMHGGGMFSDAGITDNLDFVTMHEGSGITSNVSFLIIGHSSFSLTLTPAISANAGQDKKWTIRKGKRWNVGTNMKAQGTTWTFGGSTTTTYMEPGAVQRIEPTSTGGSSGFFIQ